MARYYVVGEIVKTRLMWAGRTRRIQRTLVEQVIEENPIGKMSLSTPRLMWKDSIEKDVKTVVPKTTGILFITIFFKSVHYNII